MLEALALGCPVVATPKAIEGVVVSPGRDVLVAGTPAEFAEAVVSLIRDDGLRHRLVENGRQAAARYSWDHAQRGFVETMERCLEQRAFLQPA